MSTYDDIASRNVNTKWDILSHFVYRARKVSPCHNPFFFTPISSLPTKNIFIDSKVITASMEPTHGMDYGLYYNPVIVTLAHNKKVNND